MANSKSRNLISTYWVKNGPLFILIFSDRLIYRTFHIAANSPLMIRLLPNSTELARRINQLLILATKLYNLITTNFELLIKIFEHLKLFIQIPVALPEISPKYCFMYTPVPIAAVVVVANITPLGPRPRLLTKNIERAN